MEVVGSLAPSVRIRCCDESMMVLARSPVRCYYRPPVVVIAPIYSPPRTLRVCPIGPESQDAGS